MRKFWALLALQFRAMLSTYQFGGRKNRMRTASGIWSIVFIAALSAYLSGVYSFLFAAELAPAGKLHILILLMSVLAVLMGFFFSLFAAQGIVFGGKDNDLMLSLPISSFSLMLSRTLALYLENLVSCVFVLLPAGVVYLYYGGQGGIFFLVTLLLCTVFLALLPTLLSLVLGFVLAWISSKLTRKALLSNLLYLIFFALIFFWAFRLNSIVAGLVQSADSLEAAFRGWGLHFLLLVQSVCGGSITALLCFLALCLVPFLLVVWLFALRYKSILTGLTARGARSDYRLGRLSSTGQRRALLRKEAGRFFGTPIYLFNSGVGLLLMLGMSIFARFRRDALLDLLAQMEAGGLSLPVAPLVAGLLCLLLSTVAVTASCISLEGKQLWILKTAPVSVSTLFTVKVGFQLLLTTPCLVISAVYLAAALGLSAGSCLLIILTGLAFSLFSAQFGLIINLCFPKLDASNDTVVVKQSAAAMISIFGSMGLVLVGFLLGIFLFGFLGGTGVLLLGFLLFAAGAIFLFLTLRAKGPRLFAAL